MTPGQSRKLLKYTWHLKGLVPYRNKINVSQIVFTQTLNLPPTDPILLMMYSIYLEGHTLQQAYHSLLHIFHLSTLLNTHPWFAPKLENHSSQTGIKLRPIRASAPSCLNISMWCIVHNLVINVSSSLFRQPFGPFSGGGLWHWDFF